MGKSIRSKIKKAHRAKRREHCAEFEAAKVEKHHNNIMKIINGPTLSESLMQDGTEKEIKKEVRMEVTVEDNDDDVEIVEKKTKKPSKASVVAVKEEEDKMDLGATKTITKKKTKNSARRINMRVNKKHHGNTK
eukprot:TRINITY_DN3090_c0_g1_i1.p1 TRINITY_DN3090_c0_g1~~TRINITY_DN3090_c0_g1_i1.p1  ORF type:complete len:134 (+),score=53.69 TRINITY_DN3090_c0_g1_i1:259-660(+)